MIAAVTATDTHRAIDAVWRIESPRIIAGLTRMVREVGVAEEMAQDALVAALEQWPMSGVPDNPGAWLMTIAKRRAIDFFRRTKRVERKHEELGYELESRQDDTHSTRHWTTTSATTRRLRWWNSTAPWRTRWRWAPRQRSSWWIR